MNITPNPIVVPMTVSVSAVSVPLLVSVNAEQVNFEVGYDIRPGGGGDVPIYEGPYEATPTQETQVIPVLGYQMAQDFVVNPIPSNYGLITYNGFELTVS